MPGRGWGCFALPARPGREVNVSCHKFADRLSTERPKVFPTSLSRARKSPAAVWRLAYTPFLPIGGVLRPHRANCFSPAVAAVRIRTGAVRVGQMWDGDGNGNGNGNGNGIAIHWRAGSLGASPRICGDRGHGGVVLSFRPECPDEGSPLTVSPAAPPL
jgi:hypothetical protein